MNRNILKLRIFLWLILWWVVAWFLYMGIVPSGSIKYVYDFEKKSSFVSKLGPSTRVVADSKKYPNIITGNPAYITLSTSRQFNEAVFSMKYRRINERAGEDQYPVMEAGVLVDGLVWRYDLEPIENEIIDKMALVWDKRTQGDLLLLQRNDDDASSTDVLYDSVGSFLDDLPSNDKIALYNYDLKSDYVMDNYRSFAVEELLDGAEPSFTEIEQDLRGTYQFYTYIKNEDLDFVFTFIDQNQNRERDDIDVFFYYDNHLIASSHLDDDGNVTDNREISSERELELKLPDLPEGSYKIELKVNDDIVTKKIRTRQKKISFINRVWLEREEQEGDINMFTDSNVVQVNTTYTDGLQKILIGENFLELSETYKQYSATLDRGNNPVPYTKFTLEKNGLILSGNRVFSFSEVAFFNPDIKKMDKYIDIAADGVKYILARYSEPVSEDGWKSIRTNFDLSKAYREGGKYSFLVSVPGLDSASLEMEDGFGIEIDQIEFELKGVSLSEKIKEFFKN